MRQLKAAEQGNDRLSAVVREFLINWSTQRKSLDFERLHSATAVEETLNAIEGIHRERPCCHESRCYRGGELR